MPEPAVKKGCASFEYKMSLDREGMNKQERGRYKASRPGHADAVSKGSSEVEGHVGHGGMSIRIEDLGGRDEGEMRRRRVNRPHP